VSRALRKSIYRYSALLLALWAMTEIARYLRLNPTTVALMFLIAVLLLSAYWGRRYAVVLAFLATAVFNFYFLPPIRTFTISDPQNWVALFAFLVTALVAGSLAQRVRAEAEQAQQRRLELEQLYSLSQQLLATDSAVELFNALPRYVSEVFSVPNVALLVPDRSTVYRSSLEAHFDDEALRSTLARGEPSTNVDTAYVPLRIGMKTVGALAIGGSKLSRQTLDAVGSLVGLSIERARALQALTKNRAQQESEKLRSALLDSVTHEFRTPLTSIKASVTGLLSNNNLTDAQKRELLTIVEEETDRLNRLVGEAAEMAQLDSGMFHLNIQLHDISEVIASAINHSQSGLANHPVDVAIADHIPRVPLDFEKICEVLTHLLENAGKYSAPGTPIRVSAEANGQCLVMSVADRGPGIEPFEQSLIFDKFYRGRDQRYAAPGTGMGLAIARVIVEAHHGSISVISQLGSGSVFSVTLPLLPRVG
jgi:two-component system sensor histidine kinase KdpD